MTVAELRAHLDHLASMLGSVVEDAQVEISVTVDAAPEDGGPYEVARAANHVTLRHGSWLEIST